MKIEIIAGAENNPVAEFFSSRSTPETDAVEAWPASNLKLGNDSVVPAEFSRRLERQRDELLAYLDAAHYATCNAELRRERDEAIRQRNETNESSKFSCNFNYEEKLKAERERDELKEQLGQAMEIAEDFCGLVCYGMGTRPEDWSVENMRDARRTINWFHRLQEAVTK